MTTEAHDIHHHIAELTRPHTLHEPYTIERTHGETWTTRHAVKVPSLLTQLANPITNAAADNTTGGGSYTFGPSTPAHIEALDTLIRIDTEAAAHLRNLGHDDPNTTAACIRSLGALHPQLTPELQDDLQALVRTWWTAARVTAGWDQPQWRPDNTCPTCETRGTLRIRRDATGALCIQCRTTWHEELVGLLAEHIRLENREDEIA